MGPLFDFGVVGLAESLAEADGFIGLAGAVVGDD